MKKLFTIPIILMLLFAQVCFGAGASTTDVTTNIYYGKTPSSAEIAAGRMPDGVQMVITATADNATGVFTPIVFNTATNIASYKKILGKWLTSVRTTPGGFSSAGLFQPAPTALYDVYLYEKSATDDFVINSPTLAIGSTTTNVSNVATGVVINGVYYLVAAVAAGTAPGNDVIVATKYGAVAFDVGANGTIDAVEATGQAAAQFASAALAVAALPAPASDHVRLGHITVTKSDGAFTLGAGGTALNAGNTTVAYTSTIPAYDLFGGRLANRSATAEEDVYAGNTDGDNKFVFIKEPVILVITGNSVNSAVTVLDLIFN